MFHSIAVIDQDIALVARTHKYVPTNRIALSQSTTENSGGLSTL